MRRIFHIILAILAVMLLVVSYVAFGWGGIYSTIAIVVIYTMMVSCVCTLVFLLLRLIFSLLRPGLRDEIWSWAMGWFRKFLYFFATLLMVLPLVFAFLIYGFNEWWPGTVSRYEVSNGVQTLVFQSMSHIADTGFYSDVRSDLEKHGQDGYVLFYEGVRPGTPQNTEAFERALGFGIDEDFYTTFAQITGLTFQGDVDFFGLAQEDINVDLSVDEIMDLYEQYDFDDPDPNVSLAMGNMLSQMKKSFQNLGEREVRTIRYGYRASFNFLLRLADKGDLSLPTDQIPLFQVILDDRNLHIARAIHESEYNKIYLMYGALHFEGVLDELRKLQVQDGLAQGEHEWQILDVQELQPIR